MRIFYTFAFILFWVLSSSVGAQLPDPSLDVASEPFSYVAYPTDQMGMVYNPNGTMITPEGYLFTGYGELMFFSGNPPRPLRQRIRTLFKGYLPIYLYHVNRDSLWFHFTVFANTLQNEPTSDLINFIQVHIVNKSQSPRHDFFSLAFRYLNEDGRHRFKRPYPQKYVGGYWQDGVPFNPHWDYDYYEHGVYRNDSLLIELPSIESKYLVRQTYLSKIKNTEPLPTRPSGWVRYEFNLPPGDSLILQFKMPYHPIPIKDPRIAALKHLDWKSAFQRTATFWQSQVDRGMKIVLPEAKVVNTFNASLIYDLMALDQQGSDYVQTVNLLHYHAFWLRDASFIVRAYDVTGYHDVAAKALRFFLHWQQPDGNFVSQGGQFDGWGQTLWAFGQHYELTRDGVFAKEVFPAVKKAVVWLQNARDHDPYHLMPVTRPGDNEEITGHVTGHNFWALLGLKKAIILANAVGDQASALRFQQEYDDFLATFMDRLQAVAQRSGGYIPPGLDGLEGQDWGNLLSVYPTKLLPPFHLLVSATQIHARQKFREGIMSYADQRYLHHYLTTNLSQTSLVRGEQRAVLQDLYALLVHTTATHGGFEYNVIPWADRDVQHNLTPHGWFAARYRELLRNMLIREEDNKLHFFSVVSPTWLKNGMPIGADSAPTNFGQVNFRLIPDEQGAVFQWEHQFHEKPRSMVVHIPFFVTLKSVVIDGREFQFAKTEVTPGDSLPHLTPHRVELPIEVTKVRFNWDYNSRPDEFSYRFFVEKFLLEYRWKTKQLQSGFNLLY